MLSTIRGRVIEYLDYKGISKYRFYKKTGLSNGFLDRPGSIAVNNCEIIISHYPDLNINWVITGKGEMLLSEVEIKEPTELYNKANANNMDDKEKYVKLLEDTNRAYLRQMEAQERTIAELRRTVEIEALRGEMRAKDKTILLLEAALSKDPKLIVSKNKD